jgi:hypothetical protein
MKYDLVCQLNFGHEIWGAVSVILAVTFYGSAK